MRHRLGLSLLLLLFAVSPVTAQQVQFSVGGFGGVFIPASDLFDQLEAGGTLRFGQKTGFAGGGRIGVWPTGRLGIEVEGSFLASDMEVRGAVVGLGTVDTTFSGNAFVGSANVMYAIIKPPFEPFAIYISGGIGIIGRSNDFFDNVDFEDKTDIAGVAGLGLRYGVARGIWIRVDLRDYVSSYKETVAGGDAKLQNDLLLTAGVELSFGG